VVEDIYRVMSRINEIRSRFGLNKTPVIQETAKTDSTFQSQVDAAVVSSAKNSGISSQGTVYRQSMDQAGIDKLAERIALKEGVSPTLVKSMINAESGYDPDAVSAKGAMGLMQLMPDTAEEFGVADPFSPEQNITGGVKMLRKLMNSYQGDYKKAIAAYNAGKTTVDKNGGVPPYKETQDYVKKVIDTISGSDN